MNDKRTLLKQLEQEIIANEDLPLQESNLVFGEGNCNARVLFVGEAPGFYENRDGRPFIGRAGKLLDECMKNIGWRRESVFITNIVKRRPPENRDPLPEEIEAYKPYLARQIEIINPRVIVPLGRFAMNYFLPEARISQDQGKAFVVDGRTIFPVYHPAAALRSTTVLQALQASFETLAKVTKSKKKEEQ